MANRVVFGLRSGDFGLWISKPGKDVLTISADSDFLYNSDWKAIQVVQSGRISLSSAGSFPRTVSIPDLGYRPVVRFAVAGFIGVQMRFASNSSIVFEAGSAGITDLGASASGKYIKYVVIGNKSSL